MAKTFLDCLFEGGIQDKFFWNAKGCSNERIYQVKGKYKNFGVDICLYDIKKNRVWRENYDFHYLMDNIEATSEEIRGIPQELKKMAETLSKSEELPYYPF